MPEFYEAELNAEALGDHMRIIRERCGISQEDLAERLNVSRSSLYRFESGQRLPPLDYLVRYAELVETSLDEIVDPDKQPPGFLAEYYGLPESDRSIVEATVDALVRSLVQHRLQK